MKTHKYWRCSKPIFTSVQEVKVDHLSNNAHNIADITSSSWYVIHIYPSNEDSTRETVILCLLQKVGNMFRNGLTPPTRKAKWIIRGFTKACNHTYEQVLGNSSHSKKNVQLMNKVHQSPANQWTSAVFFWEIYLISTLLNGLWILSITFSQQTFKQRLPSPLPSSTYASPATKAPKVSPTIAVRGVTGQVLDAAVELARLGSRVIGGSNGFIIFNGEFHPKNMFFSRNHSIKSTSVIPKIRQVPPCTWRNAPSLCITSISWCIIYTNLLYIYIIIRNTSYIYVIYTVYIHIIICKYKHIYAVYIHR